MDQIRIDLGSLTSDARVAGMCLELEAAPAPADGASWTGEFAAVGKTPCQMGAIRRSVPFGAGWTGEFAATGKTALGARWTAAYAAVGKTAAGARWTREFAAVGKASGKTVPPPTTPPRTTIPFDGAR